MNKKIMIIGMGGTISALKNSNKELDYSPGKIDARELLELAGIDNACYSEVDIIYFQFCNLNSDDISLTHMLSLVSLIRENAENNGVSGVLILHGTDTLEETAFLLSVAALPDIPVIMTGSMLPADDDNYDGIKNIRDSLTVLVDMILKGSESAINSGFLSKNPSSLIDKTPMLESKISVKETNNVFVVFGGELFPAIGIKKMACFGTQPFITDDIKYIISLHNLANSLADFLGLHNIIFPIPISSDESHFKSEEPKASSYEAARSTLPLVPIVYFSTDATPSVFDYYLSIGAKGFVIAGAGAGEYSIPFINKTAELSDKHIPVIRTSKTKNGPVSQNGTMMKYTIDGGNVPPEKAALLLKLLLMNH